MPYPIFSLHRVYWLLSQLQVDKAWGSNVICLQIHKELVPNLSHLSKNINFTFLLKICLSAFHPWEWKAHLINITNSVFQTLGVLYRCCNSSCEQLFHIYKNFISPSMENCLYIWDNFSSTSPLTRVESEIIRLIDSPDITSLHPFHSVHHAVAVLSLF